ncbi:MAG: transglycosylase SLT domain-containing protein [Holophagaceae bacterium]|nr:transglycosylase SLT domain-containing protein [Holophagaceae bacterium]
MTPRPYHGGLMSRFLLPLLPLLALALAAGTPRVPAKPGVTYLYTYYDPQGRLVINNLPPAYMKGQGLVLKHVGVGKVRLAVTPAEMARALKSPELIALVDEIAQREGVDTHLARAIIQAESAFNYKARSRVGALGLMQLMPSTAERFGVLDPFDPRQNISGGVKYLKWLHDYYSGDLTRVVAAYNAGEGAVNKHKGIPPFRETRAYVPKVLDLYHRKAVQPDPRLAGSMTLLQRGRGGFKVEEEKTVPEPTAQQRAATRIYQWTDANGRIQISDQPPPKGTPGVRPFGAP